MVQGHVDKFGVEPSIPSDCVRTSSMPVTEPLVLRAGRQLFVDDFLIEMTNLTRVWHHPVLFLDNPIFIPETKEELDDGYCPMAAPFNDGVWYDDKDHLYKMWYMAGWFHTTALAVSEDGIHWKRPMLDVVPGTNLVWPMKKSYERDGSLVWIDKHTKNKSERYKMYQFFRYRSAEGLEREQCGLHVSADGVHWSKPTLCVTLGDNSSFFFDPFREKWVLSDRRNEPLQNPDFPIGLRTRYWHESDTFLDLGVFDSDEEIPWLRCDGEDKADDVWPGQIPALYDVNAVPYESLMVGLFGIFRGPENHVAQAHGVPKTVDLEVGFSRDGFHFSRPERKPFLKASREEGDWMRGYLHASGGCFVVLKDKIRCYFTAFSGVSPKLHGSETAPGIGRSRNAMYAGASVGLAELRRDGFCSMEGTGSLVTKKMVLPKGKLWLNAHGLVKVEILDSETKKVLSESLPFKGDSTASKVVWKTGGLGHIEGSVVTLRFNLEDAALFAFWFSQKENGASGGYVAAGSQDYPGEIDA